MDDKTLNSLDGDASYQEVRSEMLAEKVERNRKLYKKAIRDAIIRADSSFKLADKHCGKSSKLANKLTDLVKGGMEGFLATEEDDGDGDEDEEYGIETNSAGTSRFSKRGVNWKTWKINKIQ